MRTAEEGCSICDGKLGRELSVSGDRVLRGVGSAGRASVRENYLRASRNLARLSSMSGCGPDGKLVD